MSEYPWEDPNAEEHIKTRRPVMEIETSAGIRKDLNKRRPADELPESLRHVDFGIVIMSHRGHSNGRLSVLLSSIPENYNVVVSSDSIAPEDIYEDQEISYWHGAQFKHCKPWGGRAKNARHCMDSSPWLATLFLCDDVWLFPEAVLDSLRWYTTFIRHDIPLAALAVPGWETYANFSKWGFTSWKQCLEEPWRFEGIPPNPCFTKCPSLYKNPFGACMLINRGAYNDLGGFATEYWAHDDVFNHKVWTSKRWVNAAYSGRGYMHLGAQSWHHGESKEWVGEFADAAGMTAEESGRLQTEAMNEWKPKLASKFESLGGQAAV
jgi:hypothetical protein